MNDVQRTLSVHVNLDNKYKMRMFNSLLLPKLNEAGSDYFFVISPSVRDPNTHNKKQNYVVRDVDIKKIEVSFIYQGCCMKNADPFSK